jgi:hypothetical protein
MCANPENLWTTSAHLDSPLWIPHTFCLFRHHAFRSLKFEAVENEPVKKSAVPARPSFGIWAAELPGCSGDVGGDDVDGVRGLDIWALAPASGQRP